MNFPTDQELKDEVLRWKLLGETEKIEAVKRYNSEVSYQGLVNIRYQISRDLLDIVIPITNLGHISSHCKLMLKFQDIIDRL